MVLVECIFRILRGLLSNMIIISSLFTNQFFINLCNFALANSLAILFSAAFRSVGRNVGQHHVMTLAFFMALVLANFVAMNSRINAAWFSRGFACCAVRCAASCAARCAASCTASCAAQLCSKLYGQLSGSAASCLATSALHLAYGSRKVLADQTSVEALAPDAAPSFVLQLNVFDAFCALF